MTKLDIPNIPDTPMFVDDVMTIEWQEFFRGVFQRIGEFEAKSNLELEDLANQSRMVPAMLLDLGQDEAEAVIVPGPKGDRGDQGQMGPPGMDGESEDGFPYVGFPAQELKDIITDLFQVSSSNSGKPIIRIKNINDDALGGILEFLKESTSPLADDELGKILAKGYDSDTPSNLTEYAAILFTSPDVTFGDGYGGGVYLQARIGNNLRDMLSIIMRTGVGLQAEIVFNDQGEDVDFRVEASGETEAIFVQGSTGRVGIGINNPSEQLDVDGNTNVASGSVYKVNSTQVVGAQGTAVAYGNAITAISLGAGGDTVDIATFNTDLAALVAEIEDVKDQLNTLILRCRNHGLIAT